MVGQADSRCLGGPAIGKIAFIILDPNLTIYIEAMTSNLRAMAANLQPNSDGHTSVHTCNIPMVFHLYRSAPTNSKEYR